MQSPRPGLIRQPWTSVCHGTVQDSRAHFYDANDFPPPRQKKKICLSIKFRKHQLSYSQAFPTMCSTKNPLLIGNSNEQTLP